MADLAGTQSYTGQGRISWICIISFRKDLFDNGERGLQLLFKNFIVDYIGYSVVKRVTRANPLAIFFLVLPHKYCFNHNYIRACPIIQNLKENVYMHIFHCIGSAPLCVDPILLQATAILTNKNNLRLSKTKNIGMHCRPLTSRYMQLAINRHMVYFLIRLSAGCKK
jgi:hypothetical protein